MLISHSKKFIFIHIYKTAGTSVMEEFIPYSRWIDRVVYDYSISRKIIGIIVNFFGWHDDGMKQFTGLHKHARASEVKKKLGDEIFDSYFKFSFVRNPFDFLVSLYFYTRQSRMHRNNKIVNSMSFDEFIKWYISTKPTLQVDFITSPKGRTRMVDCLGRFEMLEEDIKRIQKTLGIDTSTHIKHRNRSVNRKLRDYREFYDSTSRQLVEKYFYDDLELLGYDFQGFSQEIPLMLKN